MKNLLARFAGMLCILALCTGLSPAQFSGPALSFPQQTAQATDPALLSPQFQDTRLAPGDLVAVRLFAVPEYAPQVRVGVDGTIQLPLIGEVQVAGLTINRAEDLIAQRLMNGGFYNNPQVTLQVSESLTQFVTVGGELHAVIPLSTPKTLLEVLAAAGSLPATASHVITILRPGAPKPIVVDLGTDPARSPQANIQIMPRDTILIGRVGAVYILGAFKIQGAIPLIQNSPLTLMQATALSGGAGFEGKYKDLRIIRTVGLERKVVQVDIRRIENGKDPDPVLQADDILFLPSDTLRSALKAGGVNTLATVISLALLGLQVTK